MERDARSLDSQPCCLRHEEITAHAVKVESRTNLLLVREDARRGQDDPEREGVHARLYDWLYGTGSERTRFERWVEAFIQGRSKGDAEDS